MKKLALATISTSLLALVWFPANAQESLINEARFGGNWAQPAFIEIGHSERDQYAASIELLFQPINIDVLNLFDSVTDTWVYSFVTPRPHIGALANLSNNGTSYAYSGLTWQFNVTDVLFIEGSLGMAYTNGSISGSLNRAALGSKWQLHESASIGLNLSENLTLVTRYEHLSHLGMFGRSNRGLSNLSVKLGYKF